MAECGLQSTAAYKFLFWTGHEESAEAKYCVGEIEQFNGKKIR